MFENILNRHDMTSASIEIFSMLAIMFFLGYLFGRLGNKSKKKLGKNSSKYEKRMQQLEGVHNNS